MSVAPMLLFGIIGDRSLKFDSWRLQTPISLWLKSGICHEWTINSMSVALAVDRQFVHMRMGLRSRIGADARLIRGWSAALEVC